MKEIEESTPGVILPPVTQIGVVVKDLDQTMEYYSKTFGLGPFNPVMDFRPEKSRYLGEKEPLHLRIGRAAWGTMDLELIQPLEGKSIHKDFLNRHGEGFHHVGIDVSNFDEVAQMMDRAGFKALQELEVFIAAQNCWAKAAYYDTSSIGGMVIEFLWRPWLARK